MKGARGLIGPVFAALAGGALAFLYQATAQTPRQAAIESAPLTQLDGWSVGAITRTQGAFAPTLWRGSDPAVLGALFDRLPATFESPAARALAERALTSPGQAPVGEAAADAMRKRYSALGRMGKADALAQMAAGAGSAAADPGIAQFAAQAELARARRPEACGRGRAALGEQPAPFLLRLRAYCAAALGERAAADLALELARGANAEDAWFRSAIGGVGEGAARPNVAARYDNSLNASVSLAANLRAPANPLANASALSLSVLARTETTPQPLRAQAAALALRRGALTAPQAREILRATPETVTTGLPPLLTALRAVAAAPGPQDAAPAIVGLLRASQAPADFAATAALFEPEIAATNAAADAPAALLLARAALVNGDAPIAERFLRLASGAGATPANLAPLEAALAILRGAVDQMAISRRIDAAGREGVRAAARDLAIFNALGFPIDATARGYVLANGSDAGRRIDPGLLALLSSAAENGALGETALSAAAATADGPGALSTASLSEVLRALRASDLNAPARRIAIEAILAGPPA